MRCGEAGRSRRAHNSEIEGSNPSTATMTQTQRASSGYSHS